MRTQMTNYIEQQYAFLDRLKQLNGRTRVPAVRHSEDMFSVATLAEVSQYGDAIVFCSDNQSIYHVDHHGTASLIMTMEQAHGLGPNYKHHLQKYLNDARYQYHRRNSHAADALQAIEQGNYAKMVGRI